MAWKRKLATVKGKKADVSSVPAILSHRRSTTVSLETYRFIQLLFRWKN